MARRSHRSNPERVYYVGPSALTMAEAGLIQDAVLIVAGAAGISLAAWIIYKLLTANAGTPQAAVSQMLGYTPGPGTAPPGPGGSTPQNNIPNPSWWSEQNPLTPWVVPGPPA
jgi:hypothetical protein